MKTLHALVIILLSINIYANTGDNDLKVSKEGQEVVVVDFREGDKIKLFEVATGDHILSKRRGRIDLSQLPIGKYKIVDNHGRSAEIEKTEFDIAIEEVPLGTDYLVENDAPLKDSNGVNTERELELYYYMLEFNPLEVEQIINEVTVLDFKDGDVIKVFEFQSKNHVITKYEHIIDLSLLPQGRYLLENNHNQIAVVERMDILDEELEEGPALIADF